MSTAEIYAISQAALGSNPSLGSVNMAYAEINSLVDLLRRANTQAGFASFAAGGYHSGGLRLVGERGPELVFTGPSRIFSHQDSMNMFRQSSMTASGYYTDDVVDEIRALRQENRQMKEYMYIVAKESIKQRKTLSKWDVDGQPEEREAV
jgi:hypothetical protein